MRLVDESEHARAEATQLVVTLNPTELEVLRGLVQGMSNRQIAALTALDIGQVQRSRAALMKKLNAKATADLVRSALYAGLDKTA